MKRVFTSVTLLIILSMVVPVPVVAQEQPNNQSIFIPFVSANESASAAVQSSELSTDYEDEDLHITLTIPSGWERVQHEPRVVPLPEDVPPEVERPEDVQVKPRGQFITLIRQVEDELKGANVDITIQSFEIESDQTLLEWARLRVQMTERIVEGVVIVDEDVEASKPEGAEQILQAKLILQHSPIEPQVIYFTHGKLVYVINAYSHSDQMGEHLREIASSISISPTAPRTLQELWDTTEVIRSLQERLDDRLKTDLLPASEWCDIVCRDEKEMEQVLQDGAIGSRIVTNSIYLDETVSAAGGA